MKTAQAILGYLPYVLAAVIGVEQSVASMPGASKKSMVLAAISAGSKVGEQVPDAHVQAISQLIDSLVGTLNASGLFKSAKPTDVPAPSQSVVG